MDKKKLKDRKSKNYPQMIIDNEIIKLSKNKKLQHLIIIILFKGKNLPKYCIPMLRFPSPKINIHLNNNIEKIYFSAIRKNPSIEDGAILIQASCGALILREFSCRIFPPQLNVSRTNNKGSCYNSAFDFSSVKRVVCVYFINKNGVKKFINGKNITLKELRTHQKI